MNAKLHPDLERLLEPRMEALKQLHRARLEPVVTVVSFAVLYFFLIKHIGDWRTFLLFLGSAIALRAGLEYWFWSRNKPDWREVARQVEEEHPALRGALITAVELPSKGDYLQWKVMQTAVLHGAGTPWLGNELPRKLKRAKRLETTVICICWALMVLGIPYMRPVGSEDIKENVSAPPKEQTVSTITPGDVEVERGGRLIVEARFAGRIPAEAVLVLQNDDGTERSRFTMNRTVDASVFGGVITDIASDARYHVEFEEGKSAAYRITTFDYPALVKIDATVTPPAWMETPPTEVKNSMNFSVPEGARVDFRVTVNKPLAEAELYGEDKTIVTLKAGKNSPLLLQGTLLPLKTQKYRVHLVDDRERANKQPPSVTVRVLPNLAPKIEVVFPKRDLAVSPIQELPVEGKVWDDAGVQRAGAVFMLGANSQEVVLSDEPTKAGKPREVKTLYDLEPLHASPRQLVSYYLWAEDKGTNGELRRSMSDMFFAEVRHFEDIFREMESPPGAGGEKGQSDEMVKLQKQVINATWRLVREAGAGKKHQAIAPDVDVVRQSEEITREKTKEAIEKVRDEEVKKALQDAVGAMDKAIQQYTKVNEKKAVSDLDPALVSAREALEHLHRAQSREHQVMRSDKPSQGAGAQADQKQLMQLELKQQDRKYEEESQAAEESTPEQQENLQVLNRLKELAARQEAIAEKLKELEQQKQQAKTEEEKQEVERQLKRLQEEQEQLLADMDELKERMEQPDNLANMSEAREKLEAAREQSRKAAEEMAQDKASQAAADATRAQRSLEEIRDEFRERTAKRFAEELRSLKQQSQSLQASQEKLAEALEQAGAAQSGKPQDGAAALEQALESGKLSRQAEEQKEALQKVLEEARKLSEAAETAEPLLSTTLYDAVRKAQSGGTEEALETARDLAMAGDTARAQQQEQKAAKGVGELKDGIDRAAERVLGSEAEALRMARKEIDRLLKQVAPGDEPAQGEGEEGKEASLAEGGKAKDEKAPPGQDGKGEGESKTAQADGTQPGAGKGEEKPEGQGEGQKPGDGKEGQGEGKDEMAEAKASGAGKEGKGEGTGKEGEGQSPAPDGKKPGEGKELGQSQGQGQGQEPGKGQEQGQGKGQGQEPGQGEGQTLGQGQGQGGQMVGNDPSANPGQRSGQNARNGSASPNRSGGANGGGGGANGGSDSPRSEWFFDQPVAEADTNPITGEGYERWSDGLRRVEEMLAAPELRDQAAKVREEARDLRLDSRRNNEPPQVGTVNLRITKPLLELRDRVSEALARTESANPLAPLDRDPVPPRYREQVRRYYTELGGGDGAK